MKFAKFFATLTVALLFANPGRAEPIETVPIGNPGNPPDTRYDANGIGSVPYAFRMGKFEVTNAQYVEFLNAVAVSDSYGLYDPAMATDIRGGVVRSGEEGSYSYAVKPAAVGRGSGGSDYSYEGKPVVVVSWYDAMRFVNWLHNGQSSGDTETGAYTLGAVDAGGFPLDGSSITRNPGARWFLPSEDEWYKAAYFNPVAGVYFDFPTGTNEVPNNNVPAEDTGNSANFRVLPPDRTTGNFYPLTDVGAYSRSPSPYGTFDQAGNVSEWVERPLDSFFRDVRGGSWEDSQAVLRASHSGLGSNPVGWRIGFRVATVIPEPGTLLLASLACVGLLLRRRRRMIRP